MTSHATGWRLATSLDWFHTYFKMQTRRGVSIASKRESALCEWNWTGQLVVCHAIQSERATLHCTDMCLPCVCRFLCVLLLSVTYNDGEMSCVSAEGLHLLLCVTLMPPSSPIYNSCCQLIKIWRMKLQLNWTLVISKVKRLFQLYGHHHLWCYSGHFRYGFC